MVARYGQPWSEAKNMGPIERKAFIYCQAQFNRGMVDWRTGAVSYPKE